MDARRRRRGPCTETKPKKKLTPKFMAAFDANEARKAAKQAALDLQAKEGDAEYENEAAAPTKWRARGGKRRR